MASETFRAEVVNNVCPRKLEEGIAVLKDDI